MPSPKEKLTASLVTLHRLQNQGKIAIRSTDLSRANRELLLKNGFLQEVMKGWYIPARPDQPPGESTAWFASFWSFCSNYLKQRFDNDWCLSPEQSINLQVGSRTVPRQLIVRSSHGKNNITPLPQNTSILDIQMPPPPLSDINHYEGLNVFKLPIALITCAPTFFRQNPNEVRAALATIKTASDILAPLLESGQSITAGRLVGAFRNIGREKIADDILKTMKAAGYDCREQDPFQAPTPILFSKSERSPQNSRIRLMWQSMRQPVLERFPKSPSRRSSIESYLKRVQETYVADAYHSLSIEGYKVSKDLIERVKSGSWNPDIDSNDREHRDTLAARGYWQAYQAVKDSLKRVLNGENAGTVTDDDHGTWYRQLFAPSITAGLLKPSDLSGYRNDQVFIRHSMHVPPDKDAVRDLMPILFDLLCEENESSVRVVLGHFLFVYIHPYMDGNGRIGRFLMNIMLASGGYPWTVIPVDRRDDYLKALEEASVNQNIVPFVDLLSKLVEKTSAGKPEAR
jgi:hypothetical protein